MKYDKTLLVVTGATASGKTALSIKLALLLQTEIISADSRQFYKELFIGTAKPTTEELAAVPHHFIGHKSIIETYTSGDYEKEALLLMNELFEKYDVLILTGGSGLYIDAVCKGFDQLPPADPVLRQSIINRYEKEGITWLREEIRLRDPEYLKEVDPQNPQRLMRALEVIEATGMPFSSSRIKNTSPRKFNIISIGLQWNRALLYDRINARVDVMIKQGLENEAREYQKFKDHYAMRTVGYSEFFDYFEGKQNLETTIALIKQHTRNFAKRQITWFTRNKETVWFDANNENEIFAYLKKIGLK